MSITFAKEESQQACERSSTRRAQKNRTQGRRVGKPVG
jgi:hypothetical protein